MVLYKVCSPCGRTCLWVLDLQLQATHLAVVFGPGCTVAVSFDSVVLSWVHCCGKLTVLHVLILFPGYLEWMTHLDESSDVE